MTASFLSDGLCKSLAATVNSAADFSNAYSYDALGRLSDIQQSGANTAEKRIALAYDALDRYTTITRYSNVAGTQTVATSAYGYYVDERLLSMTHTGQSARAYTFAWDAGERLTKMTLPTDDSTYGYDRSNQLTSADHAAQTDEGYTYDANGNRLAYTTGAENRLTSDGTYSYTHDDEGNRTRKSQTGEVWDYDWDHRNRLTKVTLRATVGGAIQKEFLYTYDLTDRRLGKSVDNDGPGAGAPVLTRFVYDGLHIALTSTSTTQLQNRYLHGAAVDQVLADEQISSGSGPGTVYWPTTDHLGTVRDLLTSSGALEEYLVYDSFGKITTDSSSSREERFAYTGREWDVETELYNYRARYTDPRTGGFLSEDPIANDSNLYRYVGNRPTTAIDPSGLEWTVVRQRGLIASARPGDPRDTVKTLAKKIRLNASEYKMWLTVTPESAMPASENAPVDCNKSVSYSIPNTVLAYWAGDLGAVGGKWKVGWDSFKEALKAKGLNVVEKNDLDAEKFGKEIRYRTLTQSLYGVYFWGHGSPDGITVKSGSEYTYAQWAKDEKYSLGLGLMFACYSDNGAKVFSQDALYWGSCGILSPMSRPTHVGIAQVSVFSPLIGLIIPDVVNQCKTFFGDFPGIGTFLEPLDK